MKEMKELFSLFDWVKSLYILMFLLTLFIVTAILIRIFRDRGQKNNRQFLSFREGLAIDSKRRLSVIKWHGKEYLMLLTPNRETVIDVHVPAQNNVVHPWRDKKEAGPPALTPKEVPKKGPGDNKTPSVLPEGHDFKGRTLDRS